MWNYCHVAQFGKQKTWLKKDDIMAQRYERRNQNET